MRQWDKELLATYLEAMRQVDVLTSTRGKPQSLMDKDTYESLGAAQEKLEEMGHTVMLIGTDKLFETYRDLCDATSAAASFAHDRIPATKEQSRAISAARSSFETETRRALRIAPKGTRYRYKYLEPRKQSPWPTNQRQSSPKVKPSAADKFPVEPTEAPASARRWA